MFLIKIKLLFVLFLSTNIIKYCLEFQYVTIILSKFQTKFAFWAGMIIVAFLRERNLVK